MTIKEYLQQYGEYERFAQRLKTEYETEAEKLGAIQSGVGDGTPRGTQIGKPVEQLAIELADKWFDWKTAEIEALRMRREIFDLIQTVPGVGRDVQANATAAERGGRGGIAQEAATAEVEISGLRHRGQRRR